MAFQSLLGERLLSHSGEVSTSQLSENTVVGFYFSAHWCPPCRRFTPSLAGTYKKLQSEGKKFEVVFVSSDKDENSFKEYFGEMPWLALPFSDRDGKNKLSRKYKVQGIPTLVLHSGDGKVISTSGVAALSEDVEGTEFPWVPKGVWELIPPTLVDNQQKEFASSNLKEGGGFIGIYFSAHWCPPCRGFTPTLVKTYNKLKAEGKKFEIIFASSDKDEKSFQEYFSEMPWLAIPFSERKAKAALSSLYDVEGIPTLVIISASDGKVVNREGRNEVGVDEEGKDFPWYPKPVTDVDSAVSLEDALIYFTPQPEDKEKIAQFLEPIAKQYQEGEEGNDLKFHYASADANLVPKLRRVAKIPLQEPTLFLISVPSAGFVLYSGELTEAGVTSFLADWKAGNLNLSRFS